MGALDDLKNKAQDLARERSDQIKEGLDKAAEFADSKTGGKHADKVEKGAEKAKGMLDKIAGEPEEPR